MANWRSFGDRLLYCHRSRLKTWCNCSNPARFYNSTGGGGDLLLGGIKKAATFPRIHGCSSCSPPPVSPPRLLSSSPLLMLPPGVVVVDDHQYSVNNNSSSNDDYFHFFSLSEQSQFRVRKNLSIPWQRDLLMPQNAAPCVGSSHGWLAFTDVRNGHPYLYNPLMESPDFPYIPLPSLESLDFFCGFRQLKPSPLSPSASFLTQLLISPNHENCNVKDVDTDKYIVTCEDQINSFYLKKVVMSSAPSVPCYSSSPSLGNDCTIMALQSATGEIAFCRLGDDRWIELEASLPGSIEDMIYFSKDERFYAVINYRCMQAWDLRDPSCPKTQVFDGLELCPTKLEDKIRETHKFLERQNYLVESSGDLLLLSRYRAPRLEENVLESNINDDEEQKNDCLYDDAAYWTFWFDVCKFDFDHNKWERVECLGDRTLFVGFNNSFSLSTRDYPELMGNSIYFTDDYLESKYDGNDNGVFHLEDGGIKSFYPRRLMMINPHPVWVAPNAM